MEIQRQVYRRMKQEGRSLSTWKVACVEVRLGIPKRVLVFRVWRQNKSEKLQNNG